jgi:WD40 repeat protein
LATGSTDNTARVWDAESGQLLRTLEMSTPVTSVDWQGDRLVVSCADGSTVIWNPETGEKQMTLYGFDDGAWLALFPNNEFAGDELGKSRLFMPGEGWAMLPSRLFPERERHLERIAD